MANGLAIGVSLLAGIALGPLALLLVVPVAGLLGAIYGGMSRRFLVLVLAMTVLGMTRGTFGHADPAPLLPSGADQAIGVVARVPVAGGDFERTILSVEHVRADGRDWLPASGDVVIYLPERGDGVSLHDRLLVVWDLAGLSELSPGYANYVRGQGAVASAWIFAYDVQHEGPAFFDAVGAARRLVSRRLTQAFPGDAGALASGIVTGDDSAMTELTYDAFRRTGTSHVTSVSGQNVSLLIAFLSLWMRPAGRWTRLASHGLLIAAVWLFALMVGMEPPALRASIVATLTILGAWSGRKPDPLTLLALSLGVMAFISPSMTNSVGFWLSAAASWALCSAMPVDAPEGFRASVHAVLMGPIAASLATLPVLVWSFDEWSPISPLANAALSPIMTVLFPATYVFAMISLVPGPFAEMLAWIPGIGLDLSLSVVERLSVIAPRVHLDTAGARGAVMVGIPALLLLLVWSRDGRRWIRIGSWRA